MKSLSPLDAIGFAELLDLCRDEETDTAFKANGTFIQQTRNGKPYWYYRGYEKTLDGHPGKANLRYVGIVGDAEADALAARHGRLNTLYRKRHELASRLRRAGLPAPLPMEGAIANALATAGLFRSGSVLVGSVAFQTYGGLLGVKIDEGRYRTQDIDVAQSAGLRIEPRAGAEDILFALKRTDPTFEPFFLRDEPALAAGFRNAANFKIEFLTPLKRAGTSAGSLTDVAGMPGVGAQPLRFLDFVLAGPVTSILLHDAGVAVSVPDPMRYAVHKLIVTVLRASAPMGNTAKALKDVQQAESLIEASVHARTEGALGAAWMEAWGRGPSWRRTLRLGTLKLAAEPLHLLSRFAGEAAVLTGKPCPFLEEEDPRKALTRV